MKVAVVGCGSIGRRHIMNLRRLGYVDVVAYDVDGERVKRAEEEFGVKGEHDYGSLLGSGCDVAVIANPTSMHIYAALDFADAGCHLLVEKPLSNNLDGLDSLAEAVEKRGVSAMVGCNTRFYPALPIIKRILDEGLLGRVYYSYIHFGQYLPDWHPWEDYRNGYSANAAMGGGILLDAVHEIDYARWFFGEAESVYCAGGHVSALETDTEDLALMTVKYKSGVQAHIRLDYLQRLYGRGCRIIGEKGVVSWEFSESRVSLYQADRDRWLVYPMPHGLDLNQMYVEELKYFMNALKRGWPVSPDITDGRAVMEIVLAAKESMRTGREAKL